MTKFSVKKPVILCIGTTKVIGDSLGPKVGDRLVKEYNVNAYVYGRTDSPVNGINYSTYIAHIMKHHKNSLIIAVDACLGVCKDVGRIKYVMSGLRAGAALNKQLDRIGDIGILGVVGESRKNNLEALLEVSEKSVDSLSEKMAYKIYNIVKDLSCF